MRFGVEDRCVGRKRLQQVIATRRLTRMELPLGRELIDVVAVHLFLIRQLRESRRCVFALEHEKPDVVRALLRDDIKPYRRQRRGRGPWRTRVDEVISNHFIHVVDRNNNSETRWFIVYAHSATCHPEQ
jgi:hypothetical protein